MIPDVVVKIHGIDRELAEEEGEDNVLVMNEFKDDLKGVSVIVSHSLDFHIKTVQYENLRARVKIDFSKYLLIDTMSFYHNIKNPKLKDLAKELLNKDYSKKENVYNLILIKKCFMKLYNNYEEEHFN
jgi:DNA polymerase III epsilon subunit-like protein